MRMLLPGGGSDMARVLLDGVHDPEVRPDFDPVRTDYSAIPVELLSQPAAVFILEPRPEGGWAKQPRNCQGFPLSPKNLAKWEKAEDCKAAVNAGLADGWGVRLTEGCGIVGWDTDHAEETLKQHPALAKAIKAHRAKGGYVEVSPSGKGLRGFIFGDPVTGRKRGNHVEMYSAWYLTLTGAGSGAILEDQELRHALVAAMEAGTGGDNAQGSQTSPATSPPAPSASQEKPTAEILAKVEAASREKLGDAADRFIPAGEMGGISFGWSDPSRQDNYVVAEIYRTCARFGVPAEQRPEVMETIMGRFGVGQRDKWQNRADYRERTIKAVILSEAAKPQAREGAGADDRGDDGEEWPDPDQIDFSLPPVPDFEVDEMLPPSQAENIRDEAERMQVPPEAIAAARAVGLGALVGTQVYICPLAEDVSWMVPGNAFGFLCANPGRMKSECVAKGLAPIKALERELDTRNKAKRDQYEVDKVRYEVELVGFKKMVKGGATGVVVPQPPEEPKPERLIAVDATVAKLGEICAASPNGVLIERDEITGLLSQLGAPGHEGDREFYLTGWNGVSGYKVDRIGRGSFEIPQVALSLFGGVQPGKLVEYVRQTTKGGAGADGLLARMQYAVYPDYSKQYQHIDRRPNLEAYEKACNAARRLFKIDPTAIGAKTALGSGRHYLHFSTEAQALFNQWRQGLENSIRKGSLHPSLESHFAKFRSLIPKTALIFHLVEGGTGPVTIDALIMAIRWGNFLAAHARRIYAGALHGADLATKALADKVKANKVPNPFRARDVYRAGWAGLSDRTDVEPAIEGLLDAGWIREEVIKGAGRATVRYWINPKIHPTGT